MQIEQGVAGVRYLNRVVLVLAADPGAHLLVVVKVDVLQADEGGIDGEGVFQVSEQVTVLELGILGVFHSE